VHGEGERLHLPRLHQVVLADRSWGGTRQDGELAQLLKPLWLDRVRNSSNLLTRFAVCRGWLANP
jgi:hypothetical protein